VDAKWNGGVDRECAWIDTATWISFDSLSLQFYDLILQGSSLGAIERSGREGQHLIKRHRPVGDIERVGSVTNREYRRGIWKGVGVLAMDVEEEYPSRGKAVARDDGVKQPRDRIGLTAPGGPYNGAMTGYKLIDVNQCWDRVGIREAADLKTIGRKLGAIEKLKISFGEKMNMVIYRRVLCKAALKRSPAACFADKLNSHPAAPVLFIALPILGHRAGSDL
jgi:hypothetical protein